MSDATPAAQPAASGQLNGGTAPAAPAEGTPQPAAQPNAQAPATPATSAAPAEPVYTLALPKDSTLDPAAVERATAFAKGHKLAPEAAQKALEYADAETKAFHEKNIREYNEKKALWRKTTDEHPELGGANQVRTLKRTSAVMDRFAKPGSHPYADQIRHDLEETGFGSYTPLVWLIEQIGASMESDGAATPQPGASAGEQKSIAQRLFPTLPSQGAA